MNSILQANPGLVVAIALCVGPPVVLFAMRLILGRTARRALWFIMSLIAPISLIFLVGQLTLAQKPASTPARNASALDITQLLGPNIVPQSIRDAKEAYPGVLDKATRSQAAVTSDGQTALLAEFPSEAQVRTAVAAYHRSFGLGRSSGDEINGWQVKRALHDDFVEMLATDRYLMVWTGLSKEAAANARKAARLPADLIPARDPLIPELRPLATFFEPVSIKIASMFLLMGMYVVWFFKGVRLAGSVAPKSGTLATSSAELVAKLCAINALDVPFSIQHGTNPNELMVDWRYADAKWLDLARINGMRRTFRIHLRLDESPHAVRATDYSAECDWSASIHAGSLSWQVQKGVILYQREHHRVFGLQLDSHGKPKPEVSHSWRFDLSEMKSPLIEVVTDAGWEWRASLL